jgi:hypothetical protein
MTDDLPMGRQFRHVYGEKSDPTAETPRMRNRIAAALDGLSEYRSEVSNAAHLKFGKLTPWTHGGRWRSLINDWLLKDLSSVVTVAFQTMRQAENDD